MKVKIIGTLIQSSCKIICFLPFLFFHRYHLPGMKIPATTGLSALLSSHQKAVPPAPAIASVVQGHSNFFSSGFSLSLGDNQSKQSHRLAQWDVEMSCYLLWLQSSTRPAASKLNRACSNSWTICNRLPACRATMPTSNRVDVYENCHYLNVIQSEKHFSHSSTK